MVSWDERYNTKSMKGIRGPLGEPAPTVGIMKNFGHYEFKRTCRYIILEAQELMLQENQIKQSGLRKNRHVHT